MAMWLSLSPAGPFAVDGLGAADLIATDIAATREKAVRGYGYLNEAAFESVSA